MQAFVFRLKFCVVHAILYLRDNLFFKQGASNEISPDCYHCIFDSYAQRV